MLLFLSFQNNRFSAKKLEEDEVEQVKMNILAHPSSSWFPLFTSMLHEPPLLLPHDTARKLFLLWDCTVKHPLVKNMQLLLGNLCLNSYTTMGYTPGQPITLQTMDGLLVPLMDTPLSWKDGCIQSLWVCGPPRSKWNQGTKGVIEASIISKPLCLT